MRDVVWSLVFFALMAVTIVFSWLRWRQERRHFVAERTYMEMRWREQATMLAFLRAGDYASWQRAMERQQHVELMYAADQWTITCPRCHRTSHHPTDVAEGYCSNCHDWTSTVDYGNVDSAAALRGDE